MNVKIIKSICLIAFGAAVGWYISSLNASGDATRQSQPVAADSNPNSQDQKVSVVIDGTTDLELKLVVVSKAAKDGPKLMHETVVLPYKREWDAKLLGAWIDYDNSDWEVGDGFQLALVVDGVEKTASKTEKFKHSGKTGTCYVGNL